MLLSSSNQRYQPYLSHCCHILTWLCARCDCTIICWRFFILYIYMYGRVLFLILLSSFMKYANNRVHYNPMVVFVCLHFTLPHYHHYTDVPEGTELLNTCRILSVECVSNIKSILSIIFHAIYRVVCIQLTHFSYDDCENKWTLSYHHQIGSMTQLTLFRVRSWNNGMRCMSFYILMIMYQAWNPNCVFESKWGKSV